MRLLKTPCTRNLRYTKGGGNIIALNFKLIKKSYFSKIVCIDFDIQTNYYFGITNLSSWDLKGSFMNEFLFSLH